MAADDPGTSRGTHRAHEGEPGAHEATRVDMTEVVEVTSEGVAELDVTEVTQTAVSYPQPPAAHPQPAAGNQQPPFAYPQTQAGYPQPQSAYPPPQAGYPQPPSAYPPPPAGYPQQPFYGWGAQAPLPPIPPQPK